MGSKGFLLRGFLEPLGLLQRRPTTTSHNDIDNRRPAPTKKSTLLRSSQEPSSSSSLVRNKAVSSSQGKEEDKSLGDASLLQAATTKVLRQPNEICRRSSSTTKLVGGDDDNLLSPETQAPQRSAHRQHQQSDSSGKDRIPRMQHETTTSGTTKKQQRNPFAFNDDGDHVQSNNHVPAITADISLQPCPVSTATTAAPVNISQPHVKARNEKTTKRTLLHQRNQQPSSSSSRQQEEKADTADDVEQSQCTTIHVSPSATPPATVLNSNGSDAKKDDDQIQRRTAASITMEEEPSPPHQKEIAAPAADLLDGNPAGVNEKRDDECNQKESVEGFPILDPTTSPSTLKLEAQRLGTTDTNKSQPPFTVAGVSTDRSTKVSFHDGVRVDADYVRASKQKEEPGYRLFAELARYEMCAENDDSKKKSKKRRRKTPGPALELSKPIYFHVKLGTCVPNDPIFSINFSRGGALTFAAGSISAPTCQAIADELYTCKLWKQHLLDTPSGFQKEPRLHFLASHDPDTGYVYSRLKMKSESIARLPNTEQLEQELSQRYQTTFPVGVDCLLYRDGNDYIGFHADDTQGEELIVSVTVQSEQVRKLRIKVPEEKGRKQKIEKEVGDEELTLYPHAGDVYTMDGRMQRHYVHGILENPQRKDEKGRIRGVEGNRIALILRSGNRLEVKDDHGKLVSDLNGVVREPIETHVDPIAGLVPGECYLKQQLADIGAHTNYPGGVSGRAETGADAICLSRNCERMREYDWGSFLLYTSNSSQRGPALLKSFKDGLWCRVFRCSHGKSPFRPGANPDKPKQKIYRYDGKYKVVQAFDMFGKPCRQQDEVIKIDTSKPKPRETFVYTFLLQFWSPWNEGDVMLPHIGALDGESCSFPLYAPLKAFPSATFDQRGNLKVLPSVPLVEHDLIRPTLSCRSEKIFDHEVATTIQVEKQSIYTECRESKPALPGDHVSDRSIPEVSEDSCSGGISPESECAEESLPSDDGLGLGQESSPVPWKRQRTNTIEALDSFSPFHECLQDPNIIISSPNRNPISEESLLPPKPPSRCPTVETSEYLEASQALISMKNARPLEHACDTHPYPHSMVDSSNSRIQPNIFQPEMAGLSASPFLILGTSAAIEKAQSCPVDRSPAVIPDANKGYYL